MTQQEIAGGIINALERGESLEKAKKSFLNAGYKKEDVEKAVRFIKKERPDLLNPKREIKKTLTNVRPLPSENKELINSAVGGGDSKPDNIKKKSKKWIVVLIVISILILAGAALLGFFWDKIF